MIIIIIKGFFLCSLTCGNVAKI